MVEGVGVVEGVAETVALSEVAADCVGRAVGSEVVLAGSLGCGGALSRTDNQQAGGKTD